MWVEYWIGGDQPKDITRMVASCGLEMILAIISAVLKPGDGLSLACVDLSLALWEGGAREILLLF
jgi:hypothetical protein